MFKSTGKQGFSLRDYVLSSVLALLLAVGAACMLWFVGFRDVGWLSAGFAKLPSTIALFCAVLAAVFALSLVTFRFAPLVHLKARVLDPLRLFRLDWNARSVLIAWGVLMLLWAPWVFFQFPTGMSNDTFEQLYEFQTASPTYYYALGITVPESFVDHHPVFDTLLYGAFFELGEALGSENAGVFLFALGQTLVTSAALAASVCYLSELAASKAARLVAFGFVALFPYIPAYAMTMVKDSTYAAVFVPWLLMYLRCWQTRGLSLRRPAFPALFILFTCLCILTKKTGVFVCAASFLVLVLWCRTPRARACSAGIVGAALFVCYALVPGIVYPAIGGVAPGGKQEALGILYQQVVTAQLEYGDLDGSERSAMDGVMDFDEACEKWSPSTVDPVKARAHYESSFEQYLAFVRAYVSVGTRHPDSYVASVLSVAMPLLAPGAPMGYYGTPRQEKWRVASFYEHAPAGELKFDVAKPAQVIAVSSPVQKAVYAAFQSTPGSLVFGIGMFGGWIPLFCMFLARRGGRQYVVAFAPLAVSVLLLFVCPAAPTRYVLPMLYTVPLMFGLLGSALCPSPPAPFVARWQPEGIYG